MGTMIMLEHRRSAFPIGIAERTPIRRAAYEQEATTPRSSGLPPTANGLPRSAGLYVSSTAQWNASRSMCRIVRDIKPIIRKKESLTDIEQSLKKRYTRGV